MALFSLEELEAAAQLVAQTVPPTPQYAWPLLEKRLGCKVWVKHENHSPVGAFKLRGGLVFMDGLVRSGDKVKGVITATRGNHGQSIALAGRKAGIATTILVPFGNSAEKNEAMRAFGAELIEHGADFDEAKMEASRLAQARGLRMVPSFHVDLVKGVATFALELFRAVADLDAVYVPIGMGSGICGLITARDLLGLKTKIIGVVAKNAPAVALSFAAKELITTKTAHTFADGMACRDPQAQAMAIINAGAERLVSVSDEEIAGAMCRLYSDTHNAAEGAGAAAYAALTQEKDRMGGQNVAVILSGGNIDRDVFAQVLDGKTPIIGA